MLVAREPRAVRRAASKAGWRLEIDADASAMIDRERLRGILDAYRDVDALYAQLDTIGATYSDDRRGRRLRRHLLQDAGRLRDARRRRTAGLRPARRAHHAIARSRARSRCSSSWRTSMRARSRRPSSRCAGSTSSTQGYGVDADITWMVEPPGAVGRARRSIPTAAGSSISASIRSTATRASSSARTRIATTVATLAAELRAASTASTSTAITASSGTRAAADGQACSETYRGSSAASEVETSAIQALVTPLIRGSSRRSARRARARGHRGLLPHAAQLRQPRAASVGHDVADAAERDGPRRDRREARHLQPLRVLPGRTAACTRRAARATTGPTARSACPRFTFEVGNEFMPPYSVIDQTQWPQNGPAFLYAARIARTPYMLIDGPDARNLALTPVGANRLQLRAVIDDRRNGNANIASAVYSIDRAYWEPGYTPRPMQPVDGSPNTPTRGLPRRDQPGAAVARDGTRCTCAAPTRPATRAPCRRSSSTSPEG